MIIIRNGSWFGRNLGSFRSNGCQMFFTSLIRAGARKDILSTSRPMSFDEQCIDSDTQNASNVRPDDWDPKPGIVLIAEEKSKSK